VPRTGIFINNFVVVPLQSCSDVCYSWNFYYRMSASSEEDRDQWIQAIQESIRDNPFHKIIADKKAAIRRRSGGGGSSHARSATTESAAPAAETNGIV
jgi:hypothetical protein